MDAFTFIQKIFKWTLPCGLCIPIVKYMDSLHYQKQKKERESKIVPFIENNIHYKGMYKGKRCFILCNGPSVNKQNLLPLKDEIVFSVSSGYHHKDYYTLKPKYHCVPQITYSSLFTKDTAIAWFREMEGKIGHAELFLSLTERTLVEENKLFLETKVNYIYLDNPLSLDQTELIDIATSTPRVQSVPIMCLFIAMYMGFKNIYLIGVDHDSFRTGDYKYFYTPTVLADKGFNVTEGDKVKSLYAELHGSTVLWEQYRAIKNIANANNITIYNATLGGALDEFERVALDEVMKSK